MKAKQTWVRLQTALGYSFKDLSLLQLALTHKSCAKTPSGNNERLEFLGDAVLQLIVSDHLFEQYPQLREGQLAKIRALLVSQPTLAELARDLGLHHCLRVGKGEERSGARDRDSLLCDTVEAVIGAIYLDSSIETVRPIVLRLLPSWREKELLLVDAKSTLQEHLQQLSQETPIYQLAKETGPDHEKVFEVAVCFHGQVLGKGHGRSKKEAAQEAARQALNNLDVANPSITET